jgi:hypothetical protein
LHEGITEIKTSAFNSCSALKEVVIPASVTSMGDRMVYWCQNLEKIEIFGYNTWNGERMLPSDMISNCTKLKTIILHGDFLAVGTQVAVGAFNEQGTNKLYVPEGVGYESDSGWLEFCETNNFTLCPILES